jgi:alkylhydroperoxidase family enzyme
VSLDWLTDAGLQPGVHARLAELEAALWTGTLDPALLHLIRARTAQLIGDAPETEDAAVAETARHWTAAPDLDDRARTVMRWVEQFVIDPHGITDEDAAGLSAVLDARECAELTVAVAVFEALARTRVALTAQ